MFEVPTVLTARELLDKAFGRSSKATVAKGRTRPERLRNLAVARVQIAGQTIESTLRKIVKGFPSLDNLPPFYRDLIDILVDRNALKKHLGAVDWAATKAAELTREYVRRVGRAASGNLATLRRQLTGRLASVVDQVSDDLDALVEARKALRRMPTIEPDQPTVVVAGYPNVGKSALVRAMSTAKPKVAAYPFTTQGVSVGHFERDGVRWQILDTPGLLDRPMESRNRIERQAIAALAHVAYVILYLVDPTETCGYPLIAQLSLLDSIRRLFPDTPIVAMDNKADLGGPQSERIHGSALTGEGLEEVLVALDAAPTSRVPGGAPRRGAPSRPSPSSATRDP